jgi:DsbC/DsbD-like thiol-disulfide interchange protein
MIQRFFASMLFFFSMCAQPLELYSIDQTSHRVSSIALLFPTQVVRPGGELQGIIKFFIDPGWHVYWKNPGEVGTAPTFDWSLPPGITLKELSWPSPSRLKEGGAFFYGYEGEPEWVVTLAVDSSVHEGTYPMALSAFWLLCDGMCVPASQQFETSLTVSKNAPGIFESDAVRNAKALLPTP